MLVPQERQALAAQGLTIETRQAWGALLPYLSSRPVEKAEWFFLHIAVIDPSGSWKQDMRHIEAIGRARFGMDRDGNYIGFPYNAAVFADGLLAEGQPLGRRGAHTVNDLPNPSFPRGSLNHLVRAAVLPQDVEHPVTDAQVESLARWAAAIKRAGLARPTARWFGHRDVTRKGCPGDLGYALLPELNRRTDLYTKNGLPEDDDMPLSPADLDAIGARVQAELRKGTADGQPDWPSTNRRIYTEVRSISATVARLASQPPTNVNVGALAAEMVDLMDDDLAAAVANELARRLGD